MKQYDKQFKEKAVKTERRQPLLVKTYEIPDEHSDSDNYGVHRMYLALRNKGGERQLEYGSQGDEEDDGRS